MPQDWTARLSGTKASLNHLVGVFTGGPNKVRKEEEGYCLSSSDLAACATEKEAWKEARATLERINRAAAVSAVSFSPVSLEKLVRVDPDGTRHGSATASLDAAVVAGDHFSATVTRADGRVEVDTPGPSFAEALEALQQKEGSGSAVSEAMEQWALPKTPTSLNKVLEIIRDDKGRHGMRWRRPWHL